MLLSAAIWIPILAGVLVLFAGDRNPLTRWIALGGALLGFVVTVPLWTGFDATTSAMQFVELRPWIERFNINYHLGVDGISLLFVLLNSFITVLVVIAGWTVIETRVAQYFAAFLIMSGLLNGVFSALDAVLFYVFFEGTLIPMFIIIGIWAFMAHGLVSAPFLLAFLGIATAWLLYLRRPSLAKRVAMELGPLYALVERKYGFDELYAWLFGSGARNLGKGFWRGGDVAVIDGLMVNGSARVVRWFSSVVRLLQTGLLNQYAVTMLFGVMILAFWFLRK